MGYKRFDSNQELAPLKTDIREALIADLNAKKDVKICLDDFCRHANEIYTFEKDGIRLRIDCAKSSDHRFGGEREKYFLQLQDNIQNKGKHSFGSHGPTGSITYANVAYPLLLLPKDAGKYTLSNIIEAIDISIKEHKVVWIEID